MLQGQNWSGSNGLETVYLDDVGTAPISIGQGIDILDYNNLQYVDLSCAGDIDV